MTALVEVRGLRKAYGGRLVVDGVDLEIGEGEVFGLLGPNGAGKTTAVEIAEGLRTPTPAPYGCWAWIRTRTGRGEGCGSGSASSCSRPSCRRRCASARPWSCYAGFYRTPRDPAGLLAEWGLEGEAGDAQFRTLFGGQKQRLFLTLALVGNPPELVFFDEITTGLDPAARRQTWELIRRVLALRAAG